MDNELITRWRCGHQDAAQLIYEHYLTEIYRLTYGILLNPQDAEEAAQDTFIYALNHIDDFDETLASFRTWLHLIAVSRSRDRLRKRKFGIIPLQSLEEKGFEPKDRTAGPEERTLSAERQSRILDMMKSLSPKIREALVLRFWAGHTFKDMAAIMRCPLPTAQSRVRIGLEQLEKIIQSTSGDFSLVEEMRTK